MSCKNADCTCTFQTIQDVQHVIDRIESYRHHKSLDLYGDLNFGFKQDEPFNKNAEVIYLYKRVLERHKELLVKRYPTILSCGEVSKVFQVVNEIVNLTNCTVPEPFVYEVDEAWAILHPDCVPKQRWQTCMAKYFPTLNITATPLTPLCENIVVELIRNDVFCDLVVELQKQNYSTDNCKLDFKLFKQEVDCDINFTLFKKLIECGISPTAIKQVVDCGLTWSIKNKGIPCILDANGGQLKLTDITDLDIGCLI